MNIICACNHQAYISIESISQLEDGNNISAITTSPTVGANYASRYNKLLCCKERDGMIWAQAHTKNRQFAVLAIS